MQSCGLGAPSTAGHLVSRIHYLPLSHACPHVAEAVLLKLERVSGRLGWGISFFNFIFMFGCAWSLLLHGLFLVVVSRGYSLIAVRGLHILVASLIIECRL